MNLAQLIDPERVQRGFGERRALSAPAEAAGPSHGSAPASAPVSLEIAAARSTDSAHRRHASGPSARVLRVLADAERPLLAREIFERCGAPEARAQDRLQATLSWLRSTGAVEREGRPRLYRYVITDAGRARLPRNP
jgi:hypothetical protein